MAILQGTIVTTGEQVDIIVSTSRVPELDNTDIELDGDDQMVVWLNQENKTVHVDLTTLRQYFITGGATPPQAPVLRGNRLEIVVSSDMLAKVNPSDTTYRRVIVSELANKTYNLDRRGIDDLLTSEYNILPSGGFDITDVNDSIAIGEVFFADIYELNAGTTTGGSATTTGLFNGIATITENTSLNTTHLNKLIHVAGGSNRVTITMPDVLDLAKPTVFCIETNIGNTYQTKVVLKNGQLVYFGNTGLGHLWLGQSEHLWLLNGTDGYYVLKASDNLFSVGTPSFDYCERLNKHKAIGDPASKADYPRLMDWLAANSDMIVSDTDWQNTKIDASLVSGVNDWVYPLRGKFADIDTSTFRFPDLSGVTFAGLTNPTGTDADRDPNEPGVIQKDMNRIHQHEESIGTLPSNLFGRGATHNVGVYGGSQSSGTADMTSKVGGTKTTMQNVGLIPLINI